MSYLDVVDERVDVLRESEVADGEKTLGKDGFMLLSTLLF